MKTKSIVLWTLVIVLFAGSIFWLSKWGSEPAPTGPSLQLPQISNEWKLGGASSSVELVEYGDFQCPACGAYYPLVKQLVGEYGDKISFVFREFPLRNNHKYAQLAAEAAEAAGVQGKFWDMYDMIYAHQDAWANSSDAAPIFEGYALSLGLNVPKFKSDMSSDTVKNKIEADYQSGIQANIQGTPTFFINGANFPNPRSYDEFKSIIETALKHANS